MRLAVHRLFRARWSDDIHREWMSAVRRNYPDISSPQIERTRELMNLHAEGSLVMGYRRLIPALELPDPDDRHVLAAAITAKAAWIVTRNLKHFPPNRLAPFRIVGASPDTFLLPFVQFQPHRVIAAAREHRQSLQNPPFSAEDYFRALESQGLLRTVTELRALYPAL